MQIRKGLCGKVCGIRLAQYDDSQVKIVALLSPPENHHTCIASKPLPSISKPHSLTMKSECARFDSLRGSPSAYVTTIYEEEQTAITSES